MGKIAQRIVNLAALALCVLANPALKAASPPTRPVPPATISFEQYEQEKTRADKADRDLVIQEAVRSSEDRQNDKALSRFETLVALVSTAFGVLITGVVIFFAWRTERAAAAAATNAAREELAQTKTKIEALLATTQEAATATVTLREQAQIDAEEAKRARIEDVKTRAMNREAASIVEELQRDAASIIENLKAGENSSVASSLAIEQSETLRAAADDSASMPEASWTVDQFKAAIGKAMYVDRNWPEAARLAHAMTEVHTTNLGALVYALNRLGDAEREQSRNAQALDAYGRVIASLGENATDHQQDLMWAKHHQGLVLMDVGRSSEAEQILRELVPHREKLDGHEAHGTLAARNQLARAMLILGRPVEAEQILHELLSIRERVNGPEHSGTLVTRSLLAHAIVDQGRASEAEAMLRELLTVRERVDGPEAPDTLVALGSLATAVLDQGRATEADQIYRELLPLREKVSGLSHSASFSARCGAADAALATGDAEGAERLLASIPEPITNSDWRPLHAAKLAFVRGKVADARGLREQADGWLKEALQRYLEGCPPEHYRRRQFDSYTIRRKPSNSDDA
jgi:hypothetical protein